MRRCLVGLLCWPLWANADTLLVGVEALNMAPVYRLDARGEYQGFANDLLRDFAQRSGHELQIRPWPVARLYQEFFAGRIDLKFPDSPLWEEAQRTQLQIAYSAPVLAYLDGIMRLSPAAHQHTPGKPFRVGVIRGFSSVDFLYAAERYTLVRASSLEQLYRLLAKGRVDGIFFNALSINYQLRHDAKLLKQPLHLDQHLPYLQGHYRLSSIQRPDVIAEFDQYLIEHAAQVAQLKRKWGMPSTLP
ncbi:substrate-binding periplasmic protein [Atopomonas hussainii]|uniref:substrate-binding periplasmic protein n=1 Tax=Atopomonas hussainii TaxID=1429083 RepID=UPI0009003C6B|nr:transporter substrate-binding domain-containing protein [Atopomonas hussainii]